MPYMFGPNEIYYFNSQKWCEYKRTVCSNHRDKERVGLEGTLKISNSSPSAMCRGHRPLTRLLKALSNLALNTQ